jgi:hypothetical protein
MGWDSMDWIYLPQVRTSGRVLANTIMNLRVPKNVGKFLSGSSTGSFSRRAQLHGIS